MRRYIVITNEKTLVGDKRFLNKLKVMGVNWWHYIEGAWLIVDSKSAIHGTRGLSEIVSNCYQSGGNTIVLQVPRGKTDWSVYANNFKKDKNQEMIRWLKEVWDRSSVDPKTLGYES